MAEEISPPSQQQSVSEKNSKENAEPSLHSESQGPVQNTNATENEAADGLKMGSAVNSKTSMQENENAEGEGGEDEAEGEGETEPKPFSYIEMLDVPRELQEPLTITLDHLKQISEELGLIKLCWPDLSGITFEDRTNFPDSYLKNSSKEKLALLYAENFRRQFCYKFPDRKPLFLACDNECGMQKMVCTTVRPTTMPYSEIYSWEECAKFVADHIKYELLDEPVLLVSTAYLFRVVMPDYTCCNIIMKRALKVHLCIINGTKNNAFWLTFKCVFPMF